MIYEGANGIQALDLVGRKLPKDGGRALQAFFFVLESAAAAAFPLGAASNAESDRCPATGSPATKTVRSDGHCGASSCAIAR